MGVNDFQYHVEGYLIFRHPMPEVYQESRTMITFVTN